MIAPESEKEMREKATRERLLWRDVDALVFILGINGIVWSIFWMSQ